LDRLTITSNFNQFKIISKLGNGTQGTVYKVMRKADGKEYALKVIPTITKKTRENIYTSKKL